MPTEADTTPYDNETLIAHWKIRGGRIIGALFKDNNTNGSYRYRLDNGGGYFSFPLFEAKLYSLNDQAIEKMKERILDNYPRAKIVTP